MQLPPFHSISIIFTLGFSPSSKTGEHPFTLTTPYEQMLTMVRFNFEEGTVHLQPRSHPTHFDEEVRGFL